MSDDCRSTVAGAGDQDRVQIVLFDEAIEVYVDEIQTGRGSPMAKETRFYVLELEGLFEEGIVIQVDLTDGEVVRGAPISVHFGEDGRREWSFHRY